MQLTAEKMQLTEIYLICDISYAKMTTETKGADNYDSNKG